MSDQDLTENEKAVYQSVAALRKNTGLDVLTVSEVARFSGVGRSTINQKNQRWQKIREVIRGASSPHVRHLQVELAEVTKATRSLKALDERVKEAEEALQFIQERATLIHTKLLDQLQYYFSLAGESPARTRQSAKILQELASVKQENTLLKSEVTLLQTAQGLPGKVIPMVSKKRIELPDRVGLSSASPFLAELNNCLPDEQAGKLIGTIFLLVGLPLSGKTDWIERHKPESPGMVIYIDGTNHTREVRSFLVEQIRERAPARVHCVRMRTSRATCEKRGERVLNGVAQVQFQRRLELADDELEEVTLTEPFDSIILV